MNKDKDYVSFGDVARTQLLQQCQYASRYHGGFHGYPNLTQGLRIKGCLAEYYSMEIHKDDVDEFVKRVKNYRKESDVE
jgi:hypothetical protein